MNILDKDFASISVDHENSLIEITWHRQTTEDEFREAYMLGLETALKEKLRFLLSDNSRGINLVLAQQHWVAAYGANIVQRLKLERYARVVPQDAFQEVVSYKMFDCVSRIDHGQMEFRVFYSRESALNWLLSD